MNWADDHWLWLLVVVPLIPVLVWYEKWRLKIRLQRFFGAQYQPAQASYPWYFRAGLLAIAVLALVLALARPRWDFQWQEITRKGADIMLVVDVSQSMLAKDIQPSRLGRARQEIIDLVRRLQGDRIGLLLFSGVGFVQCPLTLDYSAMGLFLDNLEQAQIPVPGTAIGDAIGLAQKSLTEVASTESVGKAIILITDGEDHESDPLTAARAAASQDITIHTIGIGSLRGAPVPAPDGGFVKDQQGNVVLSRLGEGALQEIASLTGGIYVRSTTGDLDLDTIYRDHIRSDLTQGDLGVSREKLWNERFWLFAGLALLVFLFEPWLQIRSKKRGYSAL